MKKYYCLANNPDGIEIVPRSLSRIRQGKYWVPDCADYQTRFNLPRRLKAREIFAGWSCFNCKFLKETVSSPKREMPTPPVILGPETPVSKKAQETQRVKETVTGQMLSREVSTVLGISEDTADKIITHTFDTIAQCLSRQEPVKLKDFGDFQARSRKGWKGKDPVTGEEAQVSDGFKIRFRPSSRLKDAVANSSECPPP